MRRILLTLGEDLRGDRRRFPAVRERPGLKAPGSTVI